MTPARILLSADRAQIAPVWDELSYVEATVVDADGVLVPDAADLVTFQITGPGRVVAVDSGDNATIPGDRAPRLPGPLLRPSQGHGGRPDHPHLVRAGIGWQFDYYHGRTIACGQPLSD